MFHVDAGNEPTKVVHLHTGRYGPAESSPYGSVLAVAPSVQLARIRDALRGRSVPNLFAAQDPSGVLERLGVSVSPQSRTVHGAVGRPRDVLDLLAVRRRARIQGAPATDSLECGVVRRSRSLGASVVHSAHALRAIPGVLVTPIERARQERKLGQASPLGVIFAHAVRLGVQSTALGQAWAHTSSSLGQLSLTVEWDLNDPPLWGMYPSANSNTTTS